jgi:hypothetical protein
VDFPNWHHDPKAIIKEREEFLADKFAFDITENEYWHPSLGDRLADLNEAAAVALAVIDRLAPLVPIFGHRFMPSSPRSEGNPRYSMHGPSDTIYYGYDIVDYLFNEFGVELPVPRAQESKPVPRWDALFFEAT